MALCLGRVACDVVANALSSLGVYARCGVVLVAFVIADMLTVFASVSSPRGLMLECWGLAYCLCRVWCRETCLLVWALRGYAILWLFLPWRNVVGGLLSVCGAFLWPPSCFSDSSGSVGPLSVSTPALLKGFCDALTIFVHLLLYGSHLGVGVDGDVVGL